MGLYKDSLYQNIFLLELESSKLILSITFLKIKFYEFKKNNITKKIFFYLSKKNMKAINKYDNIIIDLYGKVEQEIKIISDLMVTYE